MDFISISMSVAASLNCQALNEYSWLLGEKNLHSVGKIITCNLLLSIYITSNHVNIFLWPDNAILASLIMYEMPS